MESMVKQLEAHLHEEFKLWSFVVLCQKQIKNARMKATWRMQEDINCLTLLKNFPESIWCMLYVVLKLGKSAIQRFKRCVNRSWNEEVMAVWRQPHQTVRNFGAAKPTFGTRVPFCSPCLHLHSYEPCCKITSKLRMKLQIISKLRNHFQVVKSHSTYKMKVQTWKMNNSTCKIHLSASRYLRPTLLGFFLQIFIV